MQVVSNLIGGFITSCAYTPEMMALDARQDCQGMEQSKVPLSKFASVRLEPLAVNEAIQNDSGKMEKAKIFDERLKAQLQEMLNQWPAENPDHGELIIQPELNHLRIISPGTRFLAGLLAGQSSVSMRLTLIDGETGKKLASPELSKWSMNNNARGANDNNMLEYISTMT